MESYSSWLIDVPELTEALSVAGGRDQRQWNRQKMREMVDQVFSTPTSSTKKYLSLIRLAHDDNEARQFAMQSVDDDLPRWFLVAMAPALKPAVDINGRLSLLPKALEASGWAQVDADALLLGDPLAGLAEEIGLPIVAEQLQQARMAGWLSGDRIASLLVRLSAVASDPTRGIEAVARAAANVWTEKEARIQTMRLLDDARQVLTTASSANQPLRIVFDF